jgi:diguanylate cyclase (GGDEF)-like protein
MGWLKLWWRQSDHYDRLSSHLQARGMATLTRATIAVIAAGLSVDALGTIWTPTGPHGAVPLACTLTAAVGAAGGALLWALRWPTRTAAIRFAMVATASIGLIALAQHHVVVGMLTCTTFAATASYIALFHSAPLMAYNFTVACSVGAVEAIRMASRFNILAALCAYLLLLLLNLAVPFGIQVVVHVLGSDAVRAERDELTGLLTRRAFRRRAKDRLEQGRDQLGHFVIAMIDLDRFKQLNDNYGHRTGDAALVSVARALRDTTDDTALICRSGGEEFVIADIWHPDEVQLRAQQLCDVIAALSFGVTASIGTAGIQPAHQAGDSVELLAELIAAADGAMYAAKRRGGNRTGHNRSPLPPNRTGHNRSPLPPPRDGFAADKSDYRGDGLTA